MQRGTLLLTEALRNIAGPQYHISVPAIDSAGPTIGQTICSLVEEKAWMGSNFPPDDFISHLVIDGPGVNDQGKIGASPQ